MAGFTNIRKSLRNSAWRTSIGQGDLFFGGGFGNIKKSFITVGEPGSGRGSMFFGDGFRNKKKSFMKVGESGSGQGISFRDSTT